MINLEQVKLLEMKVARAIDYIERLSRENAAQRQKEEELQTRLESYQKRIDELEVLVMSFKDDQGRIEDSILAALDRLNQFEEAIEKSLWDKPADKVADKAAEKSAGVKSAVKEPARPPQVKTEAAEPAENSVANSGDAKICFEIPETEDDILDPLTDTFDEEPPAENGELDIF